MANEKLNSTGKSLGLFRRIAGYFSGVFDSTSSKWERAISGAKALVFLGAVGFVLLFAFAAALVPFTPSIAELQKAKIDQPSQLMSADGKLIASFNRFNNEVVALNRISPNVVKALIATEDHRFYSHHGVDVLRTISGAIRSLIGRTEGGSTITQQLARNLYPEEIGRKRSAIRKIKEIITALKIEHVYTKNEILEKYLNTVPFLYNAFGIEMAARTYFNKSSADLNVLESATLIGMLKGNSYYNPIINPERATARRNIVLGQMVKYDMLSKENFEALKKQRIQLAFDREPESIGSAPHFAEHVRKWLIEWADSHDYNIYADRLIVHTTIDSRMQTMANQAVKSQMDRLQLIEDVEWGVSSDKLISTSASAYVSMQKSVRPFEHFWKSKTAIVDSFISESGAYRRAVELGAKPQDAIAQLRKDAAFMNRLREEKTRLQSGFVAIDPATGYIKAWVGSRGFNTNQYDHVARAQRQPGSTFKPFVYGAALEQGMSPDRQFTDRDVTIALGGSAVWRPTDMSTPSGREMSMREGLIFSKNTITAQVMQEVGAKKTVEFAQRMGINQSKLDPVPSLALGTSPVTLLEMVSAYGTFANYGEYRKPIFITKITDKNGKVLASFDTEGSRVLAENTSIVLLDMLRGVVDQGTGVAVRNQFGIQADVGGKTGTTQNNTDGWFILMHPRLVAGSWVGFSDSRVTMRSSYWGQGAHNALFVVGDFFRQSLNSQSIDATAQFTRPVEEAPEKTIVESIFGRLSDWVGFGKKTEKQELVKP